MSNHYKTILSIAGSDSIGGAGIQADIKTATALGVYAMTAITAVTAQNTLGVSSFMAVAPRLLEDQLETIWRDVVPDAVKIGMLPNVETARIVAGFLKEKHAPNVITDPVMVATSGDQLSTNDVKDILLNQIFPVSLLVTPNIPEAEALTGRKFSTIGDAESFARDISEISGAPAVLLKGGHMPENNRMTDTLYIRWTNTIHTFTNPYIDTCNTHGTGCSLSSAIASFLALGYPLSNAVANAIKWENDAIRWGAGYKLGNGNGPINHLFNIQQNLFS